MRRLFLTANCALLAGTLLAATVAVWHDESPRQELFAARLHGMVAPSRGAIAPSRDAIAPARDAVQIAGATQPSESGIESNRSAERSAPVVGTADLAARADGKSPAQNALVPRLGPIIPEESASGEPAEEFVAERQPPRRPVMFLETSSPAGSERGPKIHFGPLTVEADSAQRPHDGSAQRSVDGSAVRSRLIAKAYRPINMISGDLEPLIRPLLTPGVGTVATTPSRVDGDAGRHPDVLVVHDLPEAVRRIDALFYELDAVPKRIAIETLIVHVTRGASADPSAGSLASRFGDSEQSVPAVLEALRSLGSARTIAANQLHVMNRQWAELAVGDHGRGPLPPSAAEDSFETGTKLRLRPSLLYDGLIRLEIHPQTLRARRNRRLDPLSVGMLEFTTDVVVRDRSTAVIGGFFDDSPETAAASTAAAVAPPVIRDAVEDASRTPVREETLLLVTPRIVHDP